MASLTNTVGNRNIVAVDQGSGSAKPCRNSARQSEVDLEGGTGGDLAGFTDKLATSWHAPAAAAGDGSTSNGRLIRTKLTGSAVIVGR